MITEIMKRMTGSELLLLNLINGTHQGEIDTELDRRALHGPGVPDHGVGLVARLAGAAQSKKASRAYAAA